MGADTDEWPNNIISRFTSVYNDGSISKHNIPLQHEIDPDELKLCQKLSTEIANIMANVEVGMGSNSGDYFQDFYIMHSHNSASQKITQCLTINGFLEKQQNMIMRMPTVHAMRDFCSDNMTNLA